MGYCRFAVLLMLFLLPFHLHAQEQPHAPYNDMRRLSTMEADTAYIMALIQRGISLADRYPDSSLRLYRDALQRSRDAGFDRGIVKALNNLGVCYFARKDFDKSIAFFFEALRYGSQLDAARKASIYYNLGLCYGRKGMYDRSIAIYRQALACCRNTAGRDLLCRIYSELGLCYQYKGQYDVAAYYYYKILSSTPSPRRPDYIYVLDAYNRLGVILFQFRLFDQARFYFGQAERIARQFRDTSMLAKVLVNQGAVYGDEHNGEAARKIYREVYALSRRHGYQGAQLTAASNLANMLTDEGKPDSALAYAQEALALSEEIDAHDQHINIRYVLGYIYFRMKQYRRALAYLLPAVEEMERSGLSGNTNNAYELLASVYAAMGQYDQAFAYEQAFARMNDSLRGSANAQAISNLESRYELARKDNTLIQKQLQIMQQQSQLREKNLWFAGVFIIVLLLATTLIGIYRNSRHRQRLQAAAIHNLEQAQELNQLRAHIKGEEQERERIARELHDGIASQLCAIRLHVSGLHDREHEPVAPEELAYVLFQLEEAGKDLRTTAHNLMPDLLLQEGLVVAVATFCEKMEKSTHLGIDFLNYGDIPRLDPVIELSLYRMVQELVQNVLKHARATQALVQLSCEDGLLNVTVEDNGIGLDEHNGAATGAGLANIRARVLALKGQMDVKSMKNKGTAIYLEFDARNLAITSELYHSSQNRPT